MTGWTRALAALGIQAVLASEAMAQGVNRSNGSTPAETPVATELQAEPAAGPIAVDGLLDEPAWGRADRVGDFLQLEPDEGAAATERSEVRVLFSATGVYIGAQLFDDSPERILETLGRRDDLNQADWFLVSLDSYFDRKTAYVFGVNAAGVQYDGLRSGGGFGGGPGGGGGGGGPGGGGGGGGPGGGGGGPGGGGGGGGGGGDDAGDPSWNAIWESDAQVTADGWTVEIHVPYSMLRFSGADPQTWGVHFSRRSPRLGEVSEWPFVPRTERANLLTRFGLLEGITGVEPRRNVQITPYTVSRLTQSESPDLPGVSESDASWDLGGDVKLGLGSAFSLSATVNPDFGQVESDPAELNLTAFETFFPESRPFFVEGSQIFNFQAGPANLVYTRRIGAQGPIIGAAKLSGRTAGGLSVGLLAASSGDDFDPERHFGVARLTQEIGPFSTAGVILTLFDSVSAGGARRSATGGVDFDLRSAGNRYSLAGFGAVTTRQLITGADDNGFAVNLRFSKRQGSFTYNVLADAFHDRFNPNDVGRINFNDFTTILGGWNYQLNDGRPFGPFQRAFLGGNFRQGWTYRDQLSRGLSAGFNSNWTLRNFNSFNVRFGRNSEGYDLFQTRGLGPRRTVRRFTADVGFSTDPRKSWTLRPNFVSDWEPGGHRIRLGMGGEWNASSRLKLAGELGADMSSHMLDWSSNESFRRGPGGWEIGTLSRAPSRLDADDWVPVPNQTGLDAILAGMTPYDGAGHYFVPVFGVRDTRTLDNTLRSTFTFTRNLDFSFYGQLFLARARYDDFQILRDPDTLLPFAGSPKRNEFTRSHFQFNSVVRWEYRPGSTVFVVWTQGRNGDDSLDPLAPAGLSPYDVRLPDQISNTFGAFAENVFLIKVNYAFLN